MIEICTFGRVIRSTDLFIFPMQITCQTLIKSLPSETVPEEPLIKLAQKYSTGLDNGMAKSIRRIIFDAG